MARATAIPILKPAYKLDPGGSLSTPDCRHGPSNAWPTLATPLTSSHSRPRHKHVEPRSRYRREFAAWPGAGNSTPVRIRYRLARPPDPESPVGCRDMALSLDFHGSRIEARKGKVKPRNKAISAPTCIDMDSP